MTQSKEPFPYEDILYLSPPVSKKHPKMSNRNRAAQFTPFAALSGYADIIAEASRITQERRSLTDSEKESLNRKLQYLLCHNDPPREITITYFQSDLRKAGGTYVSRTGAVKRYSHLAGTLVLLDGTAIPVEDILQLEGSLFDILEPEAW